MREGESLCQHSKCGAGYHVFTDAGKSNKESPIHMKWNFSSVQQQSLVFMTLRASVSVSPPLVLGCDLIVTE